MHKILEIVNWNFMPLINLVHYIIMVPASFAGGGGWILWSTWLRLNVTNLWQNFELAKNLEWGGPPWGLAWIYLGFSCFDIFVHYLI